MKAYSRYINDSHIEVKVQGVPKSIWFKAIDNKFKLSSTSLGNLLLLTAFPIAMKKGLDLEIEEKCCPVLVNNLNLVGSLWHQWRPDKFVKKSKVICKPNNIPSYPTQPAGCSKAIMAFSGGIDSTYALASRINNGNFPSVKSCIMINGFGYNLEDNSFYDEQFEKNKILLDSFSVGLKQVSTNYKKVVAWYPFFHAMGIAAIMNLYSEEYKVGVIGLDYTIKEEKVLGAWGNLTILNLLYSSKELIIEPVGSDRNRIEKIGYLADMNLLNNITVCNFIEETGSNCGNCEKCIRTMLMFEANNLSHESIFKEELNVEKVKDIKIVKNTQYIFYKSLAVSPSLKQVYRQLINVKISNFKQKENEGTI
ncbi:hypothetical protein PJK54_10775 [Cobetia sp. MMG027]|uniref:hypothetical protein n=1 Tax=Cobetia sp. MMG027 TaxID=3021980 RepID=UPI0022FEABE5|nr:hypothetical protein [Cobetia sp. MMG027]MDA5564147.1 hypothetical protein [Cobetia sp. MMG027]